MNTHLTVVTLTGQDYNRQPNDDNPVFTALTETNTGALSISMWAK